MYISLSNRQHPMLQLFATAKSDFFMSVEEAQTYDQRPFRSMLVQGWIAYRPGHGFHITKEGKEAWRLYISTEIFRSEARASFPLTKYFDPNAYGLRVVKGRKKPAA